MQKHNHQLLCSFASQGAQTPPHCDVHQSLPSPCSPSQPLHMVHFQVLAQENPVPKAVHSAQPDIKNISHSSVVWLCQLHTTFTVSPSPWAGAAQTPVLRVAKSREQLFLALLGPGWGVSTAQCQLGGVARESTPAQTVNDATSRRLQGQSRQKLHSWAGPRHGITVISPL